MEPTSLLAPSPAHHEHVGSQDKLYRKGHLAGRVNILSQLQFKIANDDHAQAVQAEAVNYLKNPDSHFVELTLPTQASHVVDHITKAAKSVLHPEPLSPRNDLCLRLDHAIQRILERHYGYNLETLYRIDADTDDPYEYEGMACCLKPLISRAIDRPTYGFPHPDRMPKEFSKLVFDITMEAKSNIQAPRNIPKLVLNGGIKNIKAIDELKILNQTLPQFKKVTTLEFTNQSQTFSWTSGSGLGFITDALIAMPRLKIIIFKNLHTTIDQKSAQAIARVIFAKGNKEGSARIEELSFKGSISSEGMYVLIKSLKDYRSPLNLTLQFDHSFDVNSLVQELRLKQSSYHVNNDFLQIQFPILFEADR